MCCVCVCMYTPYQHCFIRGPHFISYILYISFEICAIWLLRNLLIKRTCYSPCVAIWLDLISLLAFLRIYREVREARENERRASTSAFTDKQSQRESVRPPKAKAKAKEHTQSELSFGAQMREPKSDVSGFQFDQPFRFNRKSPFNLSVYLFSFPIRRAAKRVR